MDKIAKRIELVKDIVASDLEVAFQNSASIAINGRPTKPWTKRTGNLVGDIRGKPTSTGVRISMPYYAEYLEYGTGIYGPKKQRIYPKTKKALAFGKDIGGGKKEYVFRSVAGMRPSPFIRPVIHSKMSKIIADAIKEAFER